MERLEEEVARLHAQLQGERAEAEKAAAAAAAAACRMEELTALAEAKALEAQSRESSTLAEQRMLLKRVELELEEERVDCEHFKDNCEQLRKTNAGV